MHFQSKTDIMISMQARVPFRSTGSLLSGLAEPLGAALGYLVLRPFLTPALMGVLFGAVAGIMVYISLDELLPTSRAFGQGHDSLYGLLLGMGAMALSLLLLLP